MVDISGHLECAVCYGVLVDPVVGACGHDFCLACLSTWCQEQSSKFGKIPSCPLCRTPVADNLVVCLRLKNLTEQLFPEKVAARRQELQQAAAQRSQARMQGTGLRLGPQPRGSGHPRTRFLRARRSLQLQPNRRPPQDSVPASGADEQQQQQGSQQQRLQVFLLSGSATVTTSAAAAAYAAMSGAQESAWVAPQVNFTMGWWERSDNRRNRQQARSRS